MKKLYAVLVFVVMIISANAQTIERQKEFMPTTFDLMKTKTNHHLLQKRNNEKSLVELIDSTYHWYWDSTSVTWRTQANSKHIFTNDTHGNIINDLCLNWNDTVWVKYCQNSFTFDANNNLVIHLRQYWNDSVWRNNDQDIYTYDANNNQTSYERQDWNGVAWENSERQIYTYDVNSNLTNYLSQTWNGSNWENNIQGIYLINTYQTIEMFQSWNGINWVITDQVTTNYNTYNNWTSILTQTLNGSTFENYLQSNFTYDVNNNQTGFLSQTWNGIAWDNLDKITYTYDINNNQTSLLLQNWNGIVWINNLERYDTYDANNQIKSWTNKTWNSAGTQSNNVDSTYYYYHSVVGINEVSNSNIVSLFPNPFTSQLSISFNEAQKNTSIKLMNTLGECIQQLTTSNQQLILDMSGLARGMYFVQITDANKNVVNKKVIKE